MNFLKLLVHVLCSCFYAHRNIFMYFFLALYKSINIIIIIIIIIYRRVMF